MTNRTTIERTSDREIVTTRIIEGSAALVFEAWTKPELIMQWWAPKAFGITFLSCDIDARTGGSYRYVFGHPGSDLPMAFFGRYIEVSPPSRLVWTNEEEADGAVTTVRFEENSGQTMIVVHDLYPSKEALDSAIASGSTGAWPEQFTALDSVIRILGKT